MTGAILTVAAVAPNAVAAKPWISIDGNKALENCRADPGWCFGYSIAAVEAASGMDHPTLRFCLPDNMTGGQIKDLFVKMLEQGPEDRHDPAVYLFISKLVRLYPCPQQ